MKKANDKTDKPGDFIGPSGAIESTANRFGTSRESGYEKFNPNRFGDIYTPAVDGKVPSEFLGQKVPEGKYGPTVTTGGSPGTPNKPGEVNVGGKPGSTSKPGGEVNIGGNK